VCARVRVCVRVCACIYTKIILCNVGHDITNFIF
jgi:hypothetical protein